MVDTPAPRTVDGSPDPNLGPDTVGRPYSGAVFDCAPNNNGGSTTWDPGFIISDEIFYNTAAMTAEQIQAFVDAQGAACQGSYCVKDLRVTTPDLPADQYCAAYTGGTDESAAAVLAKVSRRLRHQSAGDAGDAAEGVGAADPDVAVGGVVRGGLGLALPRLGPRRQREL